MLAGTKKAATILSLSLYIYIHTYIHTHTHTHTHIHIYKGATILPAAKRSRICSVSSILMVSEPGSLKERNRKRGERERERERDERGRRIEREEERGGAREV